MTKNAEREASTPAEKIAAVASALGLSMSAQFVPFSQSRNAKPQPGRDKPWQSINWRVTLMLNGREFLTTDYGQGIAHTPADKAKSASYARAHYTERQARAMAVEHEIETGRLATWTFGELNKSGGKPLPPPDLPSVLWSLTQDASVLD
jgi:hypothetical protein